MEDISIKTLSLVAYSFSHFSVDFCCFWILYGAFFNAENGVPLASGFLLYNFIAFGLQIIIGAYCDENRKIPMGAIGALTVFFALLISKYSPWASLIVTALGNAEFHVGGGIDSLVNSKDKLSRCGVFVSTGALGVAFGTYAGKTDVSILIPVALIAISGVASFLAHKSCPVSEDCRINGSMNKNLGIWAILGLCFFSVFVRSLGGNALPTDWKTFDYAIFIAAFGAFSGKFMGGFLADKFGARAVGVLSLLLSLPLIIIGRESAILSVMGIVLFNIQMPITLGICAQSLPKAPGLAFGLTTLALLLGSVPPFFVIFTGNIAVLIPAVLISSISLYLCSSKRKEMCK